MSRQPGQPAVDFSLPTAEGTAFALSRTGPAVRVLIFGGAAAAGPVRELYRRFGSAGVRVLQVDCETGGGPAPGDPSAGGPLRLLDNAQEVSRAYAATVAGEAVVVGPDGLVRYRGDWPGAAAAVEDLLAGRPVAAPTTAVQGTPITWQPH
jgi:hypothetical protein